MIRKSNVIAVMSPKGGVGKTTTAVNLAVALSTEFNKKVLAIDTNISTSSLGAHLDILYPRYTINDILDNNLSAKEIICSYNNNLDVIPSCIRIRNKNIYQMKESIEKIIEQYGNLLNELSGKYDLIFLDCAPGFDIESIAAMHVAGGLIVVSNPEYPSIASAIKSIEYAKILKMPVGGIVLNKTRNKKYELTKEEIEDALKVKVIGNIPFDNKISESIANRMPVALFRPNSKSSIMYKKLAASIIGKEYNHSFSKRIKNFLGYGGLINSKSL